jgi:hypothetical protein
MVFHTAKLDRKIPLIMGIQAVFLVQLLVITIKKLTAKFESVKYRFDG